MKHFRIYFILISCELFSTLVHSQIKFKYSTCLSEVSFSGAENTEYLIIRKDGTNEDYMPPHFRISYTDCKVEATGTVLERKPVAYVSGTKAKVSATFNTNCIETVVIRGRGINNAQGLILPNQIVIPSNGKYIYNTREFNIPFTPLIVRHLEHFTIVWEYSGNLTNPTDWMEIGSSDNTIYVTHNEPIIQPFMPLYHTVFYIACVYANGLSSESAILASINDKFITKNVETYSGNILTYWNKNAADNGTCHSTLALLKRGNGQCAAWSDFFEDCARVHQISLEELEVFSTDTNGVGPSEQAQIRMEISNLPIGVGTTVVYYSNLGAREWDISEQYILLGATEPTFEKIDSILNDDSGGLDGVAAQGNGNPRSLFEGHAINKDASNNKFYDPSYGGGSFISEAQFEDNAIDLTWAVIFYDAFDEANDTLIDPPNIYVYLRSKNQSHKELFYR